MTTHKGEREEALKRIAKERADWLLDAVACATQDRRFLLLRVLRRFQALPTNRKDEMRDWLADTAGGALNQLRNVEGTIDCDLAAFGCNPLEPLDLSELEAFWRSVDAPSPAQTKGEG